MKWMKHPEHGQMPVYDATHEENAKKAGWEVFKKPTREERHAEKADEPASVEAAAAPAESKKRGRRGKADA